MAQRAIPVHTRPEYSLVVTSKERQVVYSKGKTRRQSFSMSTTVQPLALVGCALLDPWRSRWARWQAAGRPERPASRQRCGSAVGCWFWVARLCCHYQSWQ